MPLYGGEDTIQLGPIRAALAARNAAAKASGSDSMEYRFGTFIWVAFELGGCASQRSVHYPGSRYQRVASVQKHVDDRSTVGLESIPWAWQSATTASS